MAAPGGQARKQRVDSVVEIESSDQVNSRGEGEKGQAGVK